MPVLKNARHEAFAQALAKGRTADAAYVEAGYKEDRKNAARLTTNDVVRARIEEIQARAAKRTEITIHSLTDELEEARAMALSERQSSAAVSATMGKAKLLGFIVEKKQHSGANGGPIQIADLSRLKGMTTEELQILDRALVQIGIAEGSQDGTGEQEE